MAEKSKKQALGRIEKHLQHLLVIQLYQSGANQQIIAKHLGVAKAKVSDMLKGGKERKKN